MAQFNEKQVHTTPVGRLHYPNLTKARQYQNKGAFSYDTGFLLGSGLGTDFHRKGESPVDAAKRLDEDSAKFQAQIAEWMALSVERSKLEARPLPFGELFEKDSEGNKVLVEGVTKFRFKVDEETATKKGDIWYRKPKLFDANGHAITDGDKLSIGGGTMARIKYTVYLTKGGDKAGVKLQPTSVQIIKLFEASGAGFDAYEGDEIADGEGFEGQVSGAGNTGGDF